MMSQRELVRVWESGDNMGPLRAFSPLKKKAIDVSSAHLTFLTVYSEVAIEMTDKMMMAAA